MKQPIAAFIALAAVAAITACAGSDKLTVYGASSLKQALAIATKDAAVTAAAANAHFVDLILRSSLVW